MNYSGLPKIRLYGGGNYFTKFLPGSPSWIVWDKHQPEGVSFAQAELAYTSFNKSAKIFECSRGEIATNGQSDKYVSQNRKKIHPTQKPVTLYKWLLANYASPGDKILDTHAGSCSSAIACIDMGFDYIAYELDHDYWKAGTERVRQFEAQLKLF